MSMTPDDKPFNPEEHRIAIRGGDDYLPVSARIVWFRSEHPLGSIETEEILVDLERTFDAVRNNKPVQVTGYARYRATVRDEHGRILGQGTKTETAAGFDDYVEKAETGAIGRALAAAGFEGAPEKRGQGREPRASHDYDERGARARGNQPAQRGGGGASSAVTPTALTNLYKRLEKIGDDNGEALAHAGQLTDAGRAWLRARGVQDPETMTMDQYRSIVQAIS